MKKRHNYSKTPWKEPVEEKASVKKKEKPDVKEEEVVEHLTWVHQFFNMSSKQREAIKQKVLEQIRDSKQFQAGEYGAQIYNLLTSKDIIFIGVVPNMRYMKTKGSADELEALWIHPHAMPTLLFGHKRGGCLFVVNPLLRVDRSILHEIKGNNPKSQTGISG